MDSGEQGLPIRENELSHGCTEMIPEVSFAPQFLSACLVELVGKFKDPMHKEGKKV